MRRTLVLIIAMVVLPVLFGAGTQAIAKEVKWGCYTDLTGPIATTANNMWSGFRHTTIGQINLIQSQV